MWNDTLHLTKKMGDETLSNGPCL